MERAQRELSRAQPRFLENAKNAECTYITCIDLFQYLLSEKYRILACFPELTTHCRSDVHRERITNAVCTIALHLNGQNGTGLGEWLSAKVPTKRDMAFKNEYRTISILYMLSDGHSGLIPKVDYLSKYMPSKKELMKLMSTVNMRRLNRAHRDLKVECVEYCKKCPAGARVLYKSLQQL